MIDPLGMSGALDRTWTMAGAHKECVGTRVSVGPWLHNAGGRKSRYVSTRKSKGATGDAYKKGESVQGIA